MTKYQQEAYITYNGILWLHTMVLYKIYSGIFNILFWQHSSEEALLGSRPSIRRAIHKIQQICYPL